MITTRTDNIDRLADWLVQHDTFGTAQPAGRYLDIDNTGEDLDLRFRPDTLEATR